MGSNTEYADQAKADIQNYARAVANAAKNSKRKRKADGLDLFTVSYELSDGIRTLANLTKYQAVVIDGLEKRVGNLEREAHEKVLADMSMIPKVLEVTDERSTAGRVADFAQELSGEGLDYQLVHELTNEFLRQLMAGVMRNELDLDLVYSPEPEAEDSEVVTPILKSGPAA